METTVPAEFSNITGPERPMNAVFPKLPRSYAADAAWSRFFFKKKSEIGLIGGSESSWNTRTAGIATT
jgi:hypothetical protein